MRRPLHGSAAVLLASGLITAGAIAAAGPAAADGAAPAPQGGATATLGGLKTYGKAVVHLPGGRTKELGAGLFEMAVDNGGSIQTYCIDFANPTQPQAKYQEVPWASSSLHDNSDAGKIRWILQHSYPQVNDLAALAKKAGAGRLSEQAAAAGTQVAIWRFSDKVDVDAKDPAAEKLADYLVHAARNTTEPKASLSLGPGAVSGKSGERLGPVTVHTNAGSVDVAVAQEGAAAGVKVVDKAGKPVKTAANGSRLYFDVPAGAEDGTTTLTAQAATKVPVGRAFTGVGVNAKSQTQILAGSSTSTVTATATATWAKKGAIPAVTAAKDCAEGGVDVTASNQGDEAFTFRLAGKEYSVRPGKSQTITVPVKEDQSYDIKITGPNGFAKEFKGVLDCKTASGSPAPQPSPASAGGTSSGSAGDSGGDLASTGSSNATPMIAGIAVVLVLAGGATVFFVRRKNKGGA